ncbi:MAG: metallopeptidase TldD-related protein [Clostridium sp.]
MIELILKVLKENGIDEYIINEIEKQSVELYLIKKDIDMNRKKHVTKYKVTVFKDNGNGTKGNSTVEIYPSMDEYEIKEVLTDAYYAAGYVKNKTSNLPQGYNGKKVYADNSISKMTLEETAYKVKEALYKYDNFEKGGINSSEIFVSKINKRIVTSNNADASYEKYNIYSEFVSQWVENSDVEIFNTFSHDDLKEEEIALMGKEAVINAGYRDKSTEAPSTGKYNVILSESSVHEFFKYYLLNAKSDMIYQGYSKFKKDDNIQGSNIKGDKVNIELKSSVPFSNEGIVLKDTKLIENGVLKTIYGPYNYAEYLGIDIIGDFDGAVIHGGNISGDEMFEDGDLKIIRFSDFQMDEVTGDCFGEIRLALLKKGDNVTPLTGGSITVNVKDVQNDMVFSKETIDDMGVVVPKYVKLKNVEVAGK